MLPVSDYFQANCGNCGLLYINAPVDSDYLVKLYSAETVDWATEYTGDGAMNDDERARFVAVVDLVARHRDLKGVEWLDCGCQTGGDPEWDQAWRVHAREHDLAVGTTGA